MNMEIRYFFFDPLADDGFETFTSAADQEAYLLATLTRLQADQADVTGLCIGVITHRVQEDGTIRVVPEDLAPPPPSPVCPACQGPLVSVAYDPACLLNEDQWSATRAGDYFCTACPSNDRGTRPVAYFWRHEVEDARHA
jgi:hypothetical protein